MIEWNILDVPTANVFNNYIFILKCLGLKLDIILNGIWH